MTNDAEDYDLKDERNVTHTYNNILHIQPAGKHCSCFRRHIMLKKRGSPIKWSLFKLLILLSSKGKFFLAISCYTALSVYKYTVSWGLLLGV